MADDPAGELAGPAEEVKANKAKLATPSKSGTPRETGTPSKAKRAKPSSPATPRKAKQATAARPAQHTKAAPTKPASDNPTATAGAGADADDESAKPAGHSASKRWWQRPTVRSLLREQAGTPEYTAAWDQRDNEATRLAAGEAVHMVGFVVAEAFTPSTASNLYAALGRLNMGRPYETEDWREQVARRRTVGGGGGWQNLGLLRRPGQFVIGAGQTDPDLPSEVAGVWLSLHYEMPSVAVLVATFTFNDSAGDLSAALRGDYRTEHFDARIRVSGRFGILRARMPWARPAQYIVSSKMSRADDQKRRECDAITGALESQCVRWFVDRFSGRFSEAEPGQRPTMRLMVTQEAEPFVDRRSALEAAGLGWSMDVWRSPEAEIGWAMSQNRWPDRDKGSRYRMTLAARRADAATEQNGESGESNWYLTQRFSTYQSALMSRFTVYVLLSLYADRLTQLRDRAGTKRRFRRPVSEARALDEYISRDGLDVATITADVRVATENLTRFEWEVPTYLEDRTDRIPLRAGEDPASFTAALRDRLREQAVRLELDTEATTRNIRASAELRQAISNTRLQRVILALSVLALVVAVLTAG